MRFKSSKMQPELIASRDASRPVLSKVHLNVDASEVWVTDSYMAARFPVDLDDGDTPGPIPVDTLKASRKPPDKRFATAILVNGDAQVVQGIPSDGDYLAPYLTVPRESSEYTFPNLEQMFPDNVATFEIGLDAVRLAKLAKAMGSDGVRIRFTAVGGTLEPAPLGPILVSPITGYGDDAPRALLMPIRLKP